MYMVFEKKYLHIQFRISDHDGTRKQCQEQRQEVNSGGHLIEKVDTDSLKVQQQIDGKPAQVTTTLSVVN